MMLFLYLSLVMIYLMKNDRKNVQIKLADVIKEAFEIRFCFYFTICKNKKIEFALNVILYVIQVKPE